MIQKFTEEENVILDPFIHTIDYPFCIDPTCPCHEDADNIGQINEQYQDGVITPDEATRLTQGRRIR